MERLWRTKKPTILLTVGVVVALYIFWFVDHIKAESMLTSAWGYAVPLILAALVGVVGERSGVVNIGIEGQMLISAFAAFFGAALTGSLVIGVLVGLCAGMLLGGFLAWTAVKLRADQIIAGVVINIAATGITSFFYKQGHTLPGVFPRWDIPLLKDLPLVGKVFFANGPFALATILIVLVLNYMLFRTRWGLRTRAIGEYPQAADTAGIDVIRMRLVNVTLAGLLAGAAGAFLSMEASSTFERTMTADRGFLALAIMIFGAWKPLQAAAAALFFGFAQALASQLQSDKVVDIPQQLINTLPFVMTLIVLAVAAGRVRAPAAEGVPFVKGQG